MNPKPLILFSVYIYSNNDYFLGINELIIQHFLKKPSTFGLDKKANQFMQRKHIYFKYLKNLS